MAEHEDQTGACAPWIAVADLPERAQPTAGNADEAAAAEDAISVATDVLYALSGRQFSGLCSERLRPCADLRHRYRIGSPNHGFLTDGTYATGYGARVGARCGHRRGDRCGCQSLHVLDLGISPIVKVDRVEVDGEVLDPAAYRLDERREIVRLDGEPWPRCGDLTAASGQPGAFIVDVTYGTPPPPAGRSAATTLATEVYLASIGSDECRLPKRVQSITRQGISMAILDPFEFLDGGRTGIYDVDLFLAAHNPNRLARPPAVLSPDVRRRARRTPDRPG